MLLGRELPAIVPVLRQELDEIYRETASESQDFGFGGNQMMSRFPAIYDIFDTRRPVVRKLVAVFSLVPGIRLPEIEIFVGLSPSRENQPVRHSPRIITFT